MDQPQDAAPIAAGEARDKTPRTDRGRRTLRKLLDAAAVEFGERGFHEASISGITRRAGTALGSFYTYFDSKEEIFQALVRYMSEQLRDHVTPLVQAGKNRIEAAPILDLALGEDRSLVHQNEKRFLFSSFFAPSPLAGEDRG